MSAVDGVDGPNGPCALAPSVSQSWWVACLARGGVAAAATGWRALPRRWWRPVHDVTSLVALVSAACPPLWPELPLHESAPTTRRGMWQTRLEWSIKNE